MESCSACREKEEKEEKKWSLAAFLFGTATLITAFTLSKVDSAFPGGPSWKAFAQPGFFTSYSFVAFLLYTLGYAFLLVLLLRDMVEGFKENSFLNESTLMFIATLGAYALGEFPEAEFVLLFNILGEGLEDYATERSKKSVSKLINNMPLYAHQVLPDGRVREADPETLPVGSLLEIRPGEKIAIDGVVVEGSGSLDLSSLNGESLPREVKTGENVFSGSLNLDSVLKIRTTKAFQDSTLSQILKLVQEEQSKKARSEKFITRFAKIYTPVVILIALVAFLVKFGLSGWSWEGGGSQALYLALSVLLASCPCALVIGVPITFFLGIGQGSRFGVLFKGSLALENMAKAKTFLFDKTGTLTKGNFVLVNHPEISSLQKAASLESKSTHPLAKAIVKANASPLLPVQHFRNVPGKGVEGEIDGVRYFIAGSSVAHERGFQKLPLEDSPYKVLYLMDETHILDVFEVADEIKDGTKEAIQDLKKEGANKTMMLSGDDDRIAKAVGKTVGLDEANGNLLPEQKLGRVQEEAKKATTVYVGDGINDSPSLLAAQSGVSMGALGSDAAIEASDVVIMDDDLRKVAEGKRLGKATMHHVVGVIALSLAVKLLILGLILSGTLGAYTMVVASVSDTGVMVLALLYSMTLLLYRTKYVPEKKA